MNQRAVITAVVLLESPEIVGGPVKFTVYMMTAVEQIPGEIIMATAHLRDNCQAELEKRVAKVGRT